MGRRGGGREGGREGGLGFSGESGGKICRFFIQGNCAHGDRCHNSHDPSALPPSVPPFLTPPVSSAQLNEGAGPARGEEEMRLVVEEEERMSREAECMICTDGRQEGRVGGREGGRERGREEIGRRQSEKPGLFLTHHPPPFPPSNPSFPPFLHPSFLPQPSPVVSDC